MNVVNEWFCSDECLLRSCCLIINDESDCCMIVKINIDLHCLNSELDWQFSLFNHDTDRVLSDLNCSFCNIILNQHVQYHVLRCNLKECTSLIKNSLEFCDIITAHSLYLCFWLKFSLQSSFLQCLWSIWSVFEWNDSHLPWVIVNYLQKVAVVCIWQRKWFTYVNWDKIKNCSLSLTDLMLSLVSELSQSTYFTYMIFLLDNENWLAQCCDLIKIAQFDWIKMNKASVSEFIHLDLMISWISMITIVLICQIVI